MYIYCTYFDVYHAARLWEIGMGTIRTVKDIEFYDQRWGSSICNFVIVIIIIIIFGCKCENFIKFIRKKDGKEFPPELGKKWANIASYEVEILPVFTYNVYGLVNVFIQRKEKTFDCEKLLKIGT